MGLQPGLLRQLTAACKWGKVSTIQNDAFGCSVSDEALTRGRADAYRVALFDAFDALDGFAEYSPYTIGLEYVRPQDTRPSPPLLRSFRKRRVGITLTAH
jgi:hypothetical protein